MKKSARSKLLSRSSLVRDSSLISVLVVSFLLASTAIASPTGGHARQTEEIVFTEGIATSVRGNPRSPVRMDPIELEIIKGNLGTPTTWGAVKADEKGVFHGEAFNSGYALFTIKSETEKIMLLEATGDSMVYVNGAPRVGDPYSAGYVSIPVKLNQGTNTFLFAVGRGAFSAKLKAPALPISLDLRDATLPDLISEESSTLYAGLVIQNSTDAELKDLSVQIVAERGLLKNNPVKIIPALSVRKVPVAFSRSASGRYTVRLIQNKVEIGRYPLVLRKRSKRETAKRTFVSKIDGSVQYYGVNPSSEDGSDQALFLSLHGASVEGLGQAEAYSPKKWGTIVCPTNRRPYGFDWEEIGRLDALEVLEEARAKYKSDPTRTYLTGHSMGGHGTWQIGSLFPDKFAAIAPSAGWISFFSYGGGSKYVGSPMGDLLNQASSPSDTLSLKYNLAQPAVYVLHGDADDNVPVEQAREMRKQLAEFHHRLDFHEEPGAGHWWDKSPEPGADCVDWSPIFKMFSESRIPTSGEITHVDFTTPSPGVSSSSFWLTIEQQTKPLRTSRATLDAFPVGRRIVGKTENVQRMTIDLEALVAGPDLTVEIDGKVINTPWPKRGNSLTLEQAIDGWQIAGAEKADHKNPTRNGGFKDIFKNEVVFVYATGGTEEEKEWAKSKAIYDAETFWYRGNGSVDVIADKDFDLKSYRDRNVLLYGNAKTNAAWPLLLSNSPIQVIGGKMAVGDKTISGENLVSFFIRPRPDSNIASVAAIAPTGIEGARLSVRVPIFQSGAGFPDFYAIESSVLSRGILGVVGAGYFGNDWSYKASEFAWRE